MKKKYRYCNDEDYKNDAYQAFSSQFENRQKFESFYSSLCDDETKDEFLRVGSSYLFFVRNGDWHVHDVPRSNSLIEYLTISFKLVALLAIIESLSDEKYVDFLPWLSGKDQKGLFPITETRLQELYDEYRLEYGSIRRCKAFFAKLSIPTKEKLRKSVTIMGKEEPVESIEKVIGMIYNARSRFAHNVDNTTEISNSLAFSKDKNKKYCWNLPPQLLLSSFEEGVVAHFRSAAVNQSPKV